MADFNNPITQVTTTDNDGMREVDNAARDREPPRRESKGESESNGEGA